MPKGQQGNVKRVELDSGQKVTLSVSTSAVFNLSATDREFVFGLLDAMNAYDARKKAGLTAVHSGPKAASKPSAD